MGMFEDHLGIVIDAGSQNVKAGFAGESTPRITFPTTVGRFRRAGLIDGVPIIYCGKEAIRNRGICNLVWPVEEGLIKDWDEMEKLWHHVFYRELHVPPETTRVLHSVHPLIHTGYQKKMTEVLFETFAIQSLCLAKSPALSLYASGRTSGVVWENGYECSYVAPVFEGFHLKHSTVITPITGKIMTNRLKRLMQNLGYSFTTPYEIDLLNEIKKSICYVAQDYETELADKAGFMDAKVKYNLPDGQHIMIGEERFQVAEALFQPELEPDCKSKNLIDSIIASIDLCDLDHRKMFYNNIIFSGGSTLFPGLVQRVQKDLTLKLKTIRPVIDAMDLRQYAPWAGGSMMASMSHLKGFWLTKDEYEDTGTERVVYKFY